MPVNFPKFTVTLFLEKLNVELLNLHLKIFQNLPVKRQKCPLQNSTKSLSRAFLGVMGKTWTLSKKRPRTQKTTRTNRLANQKTEIPKSLKDPKRWKTQKTRRTKTKRAKRKIRLKDRKEEKIERPKRLKDPKD